ARAAGGGLGRPRARGGTRTQGRDAHPARTHALAGPAAPRPVGRAVLSAARVGLWDSPAAVRRRLPLAPGALAAARAVRGGTPRRRRAGGGTVPRRLAAPLPCVRRGRRCRGRPFPGRT